MKHSIRVVIATTVFLALQTSTLKADSSFPWYDDPPSVSQLSRLSYTYSNLLQSSGDVNVTYQIGNSGPAQDVALILPIFQYEFPIGSGYVDEGLTWDDTKGGWYQANVPNIAYPGLGLLITVTSPTTGRLPYGEVADQTGTAQESFSYFGQTTNPSDSYPVIDLGVLQTGQMTTTTVTYHWAWTNCPPAPVTCQAYNFADVPETIAPNPFNASVNAPEPGTLGLLALGSALGLWRRRITRPRAWPKRTNPVAERLQSWQATQRLQP